MTFQQTLVQRERVQLASYAMHSADSIGRKFPEPEHPYRTAFQRDRDRIVHCSAYRRLSGKMQVFTGDMGDYHRTRLTHTQEVASIARTIGRALRLNEDLIEALALLHDIGQYAGHDDGRQALHGEAAQNNLASEDDTGDRGVERGTDPGGSAGCYQDFDVPGRQPEQLSCHTAQGGANLYDRSFASHRAAGADAQTAG